MFVHCKKCYSELPAGMSPRDYVNNEIEITHNGIIEIRCVRHDLPVVSLPLDTGNETVKRLMKSPCGRPGCRHE